MKKQIKAFACGALAMGLVMGGTLAFAESTQTIEAIFGRVKLMVDNEPVEKETLLYDGTTYVPLRAAAEILDKEVTWDEASETAFINSPGIAPAIEAPVAEEPKAEEPKVEEPAKVDEDLSTYPEMDLAETLGSVVIKDLKASLIYGDNSATYTYKYSDTQELNDDWVEYCKYLLNDIELECGSFKEKADSDKVTNTFYNEKEDKNISVTINKKDSQLIIVIDRYDSKNVPASGSTAQGVKTGEEVVIKDEKDLPFKMSHIEYDLNISQPTNSGNIYLETFYRNYTGRTITSFTLKWYDLSEKIERSLNSIEDVKTNEKSTDFAGIGPQSGSSNDMELRETIITYIDASGDEMVLTYNHKSGEYKLAEKK